MVPLFEGVVDEVNICSLLLPFSTIVSKWINTPDAEPCVSFISSTGFKDRDMRPSRSAKTRTRPSSSMRKVRDISDTIRYTDFVRRRTKNDNSS